MKLSDIKNLIKEEVISIKESIIIDNFSKLRKKKKIHESILGSIISVFLDKKYRKKAQEFKNSPEYKELIHQIEMSTKELNYLTSQLKTQIDDYEDGIKSMQKSGINVKMGMSPAEMWKEYEMWKAEQTKQTEKYKNKLIKINPKWQKILK